MESTAGLSFEQEFIAVPSLVKYIFNIEGIELQKLGVPQQPGKRYMLRVFGEQVKHLSLQETQDYLLEILRQSMVKENLFKQILRNGV